MKTMAFGCVCALLLSGCATERYGVSVSGTRNDWVAVRIDRVTGEVCYTDTPSWTWTPIREKGKTVEKPKTAALEEPSRHKAEMAKMTDEQLKTRLRELREKYHSAGHKREQASDALVKTRPGPSLARPVSYWEAMSSWEMETDQAIRNIETQAALEWAEQEGKAILPSLKEAESAYKERLLSRFKAGQQLPAN